MTKLGIVASAALVFAAACGEVSPDARANKTDPSSGPADAGAPVRVTEDAGRTRFVPGEPDAQAADPRRLPVCSPGVSIIGRTFAQGDTVIVGSDLAQTFVAETSGIVTDVRLAVRRCGGAAAERLNILVSEEGGRQERIAETSIAFLREDCSDNLPPVDIVADLRSECGRVEVGKRYRLRVHAPLSLSTTQAPTYRFAVSASDGYPEGVLSHLTKAGQVDDVGDLAFRLNVAP